MATAEQRSSIEKSIAKVQNPLMETRLIHHNFEIFNTPYLEKVFANVRLKLRPDAGSQGQWDNLVNIHDSDNEGSSSSRVVLHKKMFTTKNTDFEQLKTLFDITQKLILEQRIEIHGVSTIEGHVTSWRRSTLLHDKENKLSKARPHVYSDSVLCLGKMHPHPTGMEKWREQLE